MWQPMGWGNSAAPSEGSLLLTPCTSRQWGTFIAAYGAHTTADPSGQRVNWQRTAVGHRASILR